MKKLFWLLALLVGLGVAEPAHAQQVNAQIFNSISGPCKIRSGSGSPEGAVVGNVCDVYLRSNGSTDTTIYVKESGTSNTGWLALLNAGGGSGSWTNPMTSAAIAAIVSDETGSGLLTFATSPTLGTPSMTTPNFTSGSALATTGNADIWLAPTAQLSGTEKAALTMGAAANAGDGARGDIALTLGWNNQSDGSARVSGEPAVMLRFENYYRPASTSCNTSTHGCQEIHFQWVSSAGTIYRPWGAQMIDTGESIALSYNSDSVSFLDKTAGTQYFKLDSGGTVGFYSGTAALKHTNAQQWLKQLNSTADHYNNLIYTDASDRVVLGDSTASTGTGNVELTSKTAAFLTQFGGTTSSFPALKRSSTILQARLADDSTYAPFEASTLGVGGSASTFLFYVQGSANDFGTVSARIANTNTGSGAYSSFDVLTGANNIRIYTPSENVALQEGFLVTSGTMAMNYGIGNAAYWQMTGGATIGNWIPYNDNANSLGNASHRVSTLYWGTGSAGGTGTPTAAIPFYYQTSRAGQIQFQIQNTSSNAAAYAELLVKNDTTNAYIGAEGASSSDVSANRGYLASTSTTSSPTRGLDIFGCFTVGNACTIRMMLGGTAADSRGTWSTAGLTMANGGILDVPLTALASTSTDGLVLENTTASTGGTTEQYSPRLRLRGTAWDTAASQTSDWIIENEPATAATPTSTIRFKHSLNGAAYVEAYRVANSGVMTVANAVTAGNSGFIASASGGCFYVQSRAGWCSSADGVLNLFNFAATGFTRLGFGGTSSSFPALKRSSADLIVRLADDSADATLEAGAFLTSTPGSLTNKLISVAGTIGHPTPVAIDISTTMQAGSAGTENGRAININPVFSLAGNASQVNGIYIPAFTVTLNSFTVTDSTALRIAGTPTNGTNKRSIWVEAGTSRFDGVVSIADGSNGTPSLTFTSDTDTGFFWGGSGHITYNANGIRPLDFNGNGVYTGSDGGFWWSNTAGNSTATLDTNITRISAGVLGIGTTAAAGFTGSIKLTDLNYVGKIQITGVTWESATAPTIASGGCTSPAVTHSNGTAAFLITVGTTCAGVKTFVLTMPAAAHFWSCSGDNHTSDAAQQTNYIVARATSTTAVTVTSYDRTTGLQEDFTDSDAYLLHCSAE